MKQGVYNTEMDCVKRRKRESLNYQKRIKNSLLFPGKYQDLGENWKKIIFSDEKKFDLDGLVDIIFIGLGFTRKKLFFTEDPWMAKNHDLGPFKLSRKILPGLYYWNGQ